MGATCLIKRDYFRLTLTFYPSKCCLAHVHRFLSLVHTHSDDQIGLGIVEGSVAFSSFFVPTVYCIPFHNRRCILPSLQKRVPIDANFATFESLISSLRGAA